MKRHLKKRLNALILSQKSRQVNVSAADFTLIFADDEIKIYDIKGTSLCCSEKIRQQLLDGEVSIEALEVAASAVRGEG